MKRSFLVSGGVLTGIASVLGVNPLHTGAATALASAPTASKAVAASTMAKSTLKTRTLNGSPISYQFGTVQVQLKLSGNRITAVKVLQAPSGRSQQFTDFSIPTLTSEVLKAQSAKIALVSGATYTSMGFIKSLASALQQR